MNNILVPEVVPDGREPLIYLDSGSSSFRSLPIFVAARFRRSSEWLSEPNTSRFARQSERSETNESERLSSQRKVEAHDDVLDADVGRASLLVRFSRNRLWPF